MNPIYNFHPLTKEYLGEGVADESPLEPGVPLVPANATFVAPPIIDEHEAAVFNGSSWETIADYRGVSYWLAGELVRIDELGIGPPQGSLPGKPEPTLAELKALKNAEINAARLTANFSTFTHGGKVFSCDELSRSDIDGTTGTVALTGGFPANWPGGWKAIDNTYIPITTRAQWEAFYLSFGATGAQNFAHAQVLKTALAAATTAEQVAAIIW